MKYDLAEHLRSHNKRLTTTKKLVFDRLDNHAAVTINELRDEMRDQLDEATLYRTIRQFREFQIVRDVVINGVRKIELSEKFSDHHHHLICIKCGDVANINDTKLEQYLKLLAARKGYLHRSHSFEVQGLCPACSPSYRELAKESTAVNDDLRTGHVA